MTGDAAPLPFDVLGLGAATVDDILYVKDFPLSDSKIEVQRRRRFLGGQAAIALIAAARLGSSTAYAGLLGHDEFSEFVVSTLRQEGVNLDYLVRRTEARPVLATIIVGEQPSTRNIFFELNECSGADPKLPAPEVIRAARVLLVDHIGVEGMLRAARIAREASIPIVSDLEIGSSPYFPELLGLVDHLILSRDFATELTGESQPDRAARALWTPQRQVVVITCGAEGAWYTTGDKAQRQPAFAVNAVDTTGCGDVFHGAYAACLARGLAIPECIRFASAAAALKAAQSGGHQSIPSRTAVEALLKRE